VGCFGIKLSIIGEFFQLMTSTPFQKATYRDVLGLRPRAWIVPSCAIIALPIYHHIAIVGRSLLGAHHGFVRRFEVVRIDR